MTTRLALASGILVAGVLALGGCNKKAEEKPAEPPSMARVTDTKVFLCQEGMQITAFYGTNAKGEPDLELIVDGTNFKLVPTPAPDGRRFATPPDFRNAGGIPPETGVVWWERANGDYLLQQVPMAQLADPDAAKTARTCELKS